MTLVSENSKSLFNKHCDERIADDWQPHGNLCVTATYDGLVFSQMFAMYEEPAKC
jgi:hypothetical protein